MNKFVFFVAFCGFTIHLTLSQLDGYVPGQDYPIYNEIPKGLSFKCDQRLPGYYSDPEAQCQVWHWCLPSGQQYSFLCPNGTIFNQFARVCDWWFNVDCANTPSMYNINEDLYIVPENAKRSRRHHDDEENNESTFPAVPVVPVIPQSTQRGRRQQPYINTQSQRSQPHSFQLNQQITPEINISPPFTSQRGRRHNTDSVNVANVVSEDIQRRRRRQPVVEEMVAPTENPNPRGRRRFNQNY